LQIGEWRLRIGEWRTGGRVRRNLDDSGSSLCPISPRHRTQQLRWRWGLSWNSKLPDSCSPATAANNSSKLCRLQSRELLYAGYLIIIASISTPRGTSRLRNAMLGCGLERRDEHWIEHGLQRNAYGRRTHVIANAGNSKCLAFANSPGH
jgi:hypothetical protein